VLLRGSFWLPEVQPALRGIPKAQGRLKIQDGVWSLNSKKNEKKLVFSQKNRDNSKKIYGRGVIPSKREKQAKHRQQPEYRSNRSRNNTETR
jgi:putative cell wall-binding protein